MAVDRAVLYALAAAVFALLALVCRVQPEFGYVHERGQAFRNYLLLQSRDPEAQVHIPLDVIHVDELNATRFFSSMYRNEPFIIEGAGRKLPAFDKWAGPRADAYLRSRAGAMTVDVEQSRDGRFAEFMPGWRKEDMKLETFLDEYRTGGGGEESAMKMYLAEVDVPEPLLEDVPFYSFASFLDVNDKDVSRKMWLSHVGDGGEDVEDASAVSRATVGVGNSVGGGGDQAVDDVEEGLDRGGARRKRGGSKAKAKTKTQQSLPHTDNFENILVQLEGAKELVIVPPSHGLWVYAGGWYDEARKRLPPHYSPVNFHNPDRLRHPKFFRCNPINIRLEAGDALYLPSYWWHHVKAGSTGRNLAVNFWYPTVSAVLRVAMDGMEEGVY